MAKIEYIDPKIIGNLTEELVNLIPKYKSALDKEYDDTRLYDRKSLDFRTIIDNSFPVLLVIDYKDIRKELEKYLDIQQSLKELLGDDYDLSKIQTQYSSTKLSTQEIDLIIKIIKGAIDQLKKSCVNLEWYDVSDKLLLALRDAELNPNSKNSELKPQILKNVRQRLPERIHIVGVSNTTDKEFFLFTKGFESLSGRLRDLFEAEIEQLSARRKFGTKGSIGEFLDFGHVAVGWSNKSRGRSVAFNTPKLLNIIFNVVVDSANQASAIEANVNLAVQQFVTDTKIDETYVEVEKIFGDEVASIFIRIGGSAVRLENAIINTERGFKVERNTQRQSSKQTLLKLAQQFKNLGKTTLGSKIEALISKGKNSDSLIEHIAKTVIAKITGQKIQKTRSKTSKSKRTAIKERVPVVRNGVVKGPVKLKRLPKLPELKTPIIVDEISDEGSLTGIQALLNSNLVQTVKQNMGAGNRRDILNLRSGRFAESVRVERLTQSRSGMISAFYNYMRYPYATFSAGGKQELPRSRDPKLLIAKSIRQVAAQAKITRLRAVLV